MLARMVVLVLGVMMGSAVAAETGDVAHAELTGEVTYQVGPADILSIEVFGEEDLTRDLTVDRDGNINVPYVGRIHVAEFTPDEVSELVRVQLMDGFLRDPQVTVRVAEYRSKPVVVLGEVENEGTYFLEGETDILELLSSAGGVPESVTTVRIHRPGADGQQSSIDVNLERLSQGDTTQRVMMQGGDHVQVLNPQLVFVTGEVKEEGAIPWRDDLTAWQALTTAGGPETTARLRTAYIVRNGDPIEVDLKSVKQGRTADVLLRPGDQLVIPESAF